MTALIVTTYPIFLPTSEDRAFINICQDGEPEIFMTRIGDYFLFLTECLDREQSKSSMKRELFVKRMSFIQSFIDNSINNGDFILPRERVFYLVHDLDILDTHHNGLYPTSTSKFDDGDPLKEFFLEGHLYLFMHEDGLELYDSFVGFLPNDITEAHMIKSISYFGNHNEA